MNALARFADSRRTWLPGGIVGREIRAALPVVLSLAFLPSLLSVVVWRLAFWSSHERFGMIEAMRIFWIFTSVLTAFLLGGLCGAEEEENQTLEFVLTQPISPLRVLAEKVAGSALAFLLWAVVSLQAFPPSARDLVLLQPLWLPAFFVPLGVGVWMRKVMLTVIVSGALFMFVLLPLAAATAPGGMAESGFPSGNVSPLLFVFAALGLMSAVVRYETRGMDGRVAGL